MKNSIGTVKNIINKDSSIKNFCHQHKINDEQLLNYFGKLMIQLENNKICGNCDGKECKMDPLAFQTELVYEDNRVNLLYIKCDKFVGGGINSIDMLHFPNSQQFYNQKLILHASRAIAFKYIDEFKTNYKEGVFSKGIYFHGIFGTGKTFLMLQLAKNLAAQGVNVMVAYYPDLVRFIKSSIGTSELEKTINKMKYVEILMLDDVGAENNTSFIRDEVLGPVLQFRLQSNKPVFMTSNLNFDLLRKHFMESKDQTDAIKSDRIVERIRYLMYSVELDDRNYRY